jgi:hypothetical protein
MSETNLLVCHPGPDRHESLFGYMLRLSEVNGYSTFFQLMRRAGLKQSEARTTGMKVTKLARVANCPIHELEAIAHYDLSNSRHARLAGHKLLPIHLRRMKPAICPECVAGKGYIEAHWELLAMTGCPLHKRTLLSSCEKCGKQLRWFRRGLRECSCGAQLMGVDLPLIPQEEAELLDVVRRCVLRLPAPTDTLSKLPIEDLRRMELHPLLTLIHVLGHHYRALRQTTENSYVGSDTRCAAEVLSDCLRTTKYRVYAAGRFRIGYSALLCA